MNEDRIIDLYENAYAIFDGLTPIKADCGELCSRRCCRGGRKDGMVLFPGEELFLKQNRFLWPFLTIKNAERRGRPVKFAVCSGFRCRRGWRPLACRIFPLAPVLTGDGSVEAVADTRAKYLCPLLAAEECIEPEFRAAVKKAFTQLLMIPDMREFLTENAAVMKDYERFTGK